MPPFLKLLRAPETGVLLLAIAGLAHSYSASVSHADEKLSAVRIVFQNTTDTNVDIYLVIPADGEQEESQDLFAPKLPAGKQHLQTGIVGTTWRIMQNGKVVADYVANAESIQPVDLAKLIAWQSPVTLVFQNTTDSDVDLFWFDTDGNEKLIAKGLNPKREWSSQSMPGDSWSIKSDGHLLAEVVADSHSVQVVNVAAMAAWLKPVDLVFQNQSYSPIEIFLVDTNGKEECYTVSKNGRPFPMPVGTRLRQTAYPNSLWRVRQNGKVVAEFSPDAEPIQFVDITGQSP